MFQTMTRRRFVSAMGTAAMLGLAGLCTGCSSYPSTQEALSSVRKTSSLSSGATLADGVLTVGVNTSNAPYCWPTSDGESLQGIDVDVALALGDELGLEVKFVNVGTTYNGAAGGTCDIAMGVTTSTLPGSEVLVGNYAESAPAVFARNFSGTVSDADLNSATVGVQSDSASARAAQQIAPNAQLMPFSTLNDAFASLETDGVNFVACDSFMGGYLAMSYDDITLVGAFSLAETRGVAIAATATELASTVTSAFDSLTSSGELSSIRQRWVGDLATVSSSNQVTNTGIAQVATDTAAEQTAESESTEGEGESTEESY